MLNTSPSKAREYFTKDRGALLDLHKESFGKVLEIGCGAGLVLAEAKRRGAEWVCGIELDESAFESARKVDAIDSVLHLNVEKDKLPFQDELFDQIIASHVIEHFQDPWRVMIKLVALLRPGGTILLALPNMRQVNVAWSYLVKGNWEYAPSGILDWTHLRFFTRASMLQFVAWAGLQVKGCQGEFWGPKSRMLSKLSLGALDEFGAYAYNIRAIKPEGWMPPKQYPFGGSLALTI